MGEVCTIYQDFFILTRGGASAQAKLLRFANSLVRRAVLTIIKGTVRVSLVDALQHAELGAEFLKFIRCRAGNTRSGESGGAFRLTRLGWHRMRNSPTLYVWDNFVISSHKKTYPSQIIHVHFLGLRTGHWNVKRDNQHA